MSQLIKWMNLIMVDRVTLSVCAFSNGSTWELVGPDPYRETIVCPGGPLEVAVLDVKGEIFHGNVTRTLEHPVAEPGHLPGPLDDHVGVDGGGVVGRVRVVVQDDVWPPDPVIGEADRLDASKVRIVPRQVRVIPNLVRDICCKIWRV